MQQHVSQHWLWQQNVIGPSLLYHQVHDALLFKQLLLHSLLLHSLLLQSLLLPYAGMWQAVCFRTLLWGKRRLLLSALRQKLFVLSLLLLLLLLCNGKAANQTVIAYDAVTVSHAVKSSRW